MAGLGFKDFQVGEVLTSSDVDGYLMQQAVMRFADAGARGSALGTAPGTAVALAEGMLTYLDSLNAIQVYDGSGWRDPSVGIGTNVASTASTSSFTTSSTSLTDITGVSVSITPSTDTSKILVIAQTHGSIGSNATTWRTVGIGVTRNGTLIYEQVESTALSVSEQIVMVHYLDSPATTSAVTYQLQTLAGVGGNTSVSGAIITAIEVAA